MLRPAPGCGIMEYTVLIHQAEEGGFWAEVPELPGCYSQGETIEEALRNSREAIETHLMAVKVEATRKELESLRQDELKRQL